jgi:hypothetical protein
MVDVSIVGSTVNQNNADNGAGIALLDDAESVLYDALVNENTAVTDGGGFYIDGAQTELLVLGAGTINDNSAGRGGGLFVDSGEVTLLGQSLRRNSATTEGGAIRTASGAVVQLSAAKVTRNSAGTMGGAFAVPSGNFEIEGSNVKYNNAGTDGGGVTVAKNGIFTAENVWFHENTAEGRGGGLAVLANDELSNPTVNILGSMTAEGCGSRGPITANQYCSEFRGNHAVGGGGAIIAEDGNIEIYRTAFLSNTADTHGAALRLENHPLAAPLVIANNILVVNNGNYPTQDIIRVAGGSLVATHATSADNVGTPLWIGPLSYGNAWWRSIVWDLANVVVDPAATLPAGCSMFRVVTGVTTGSNRDFGLDPFFMTTARGDYRLDPIVSVNAVDQCVLGLPRDLDYVARPQGSSFDRGAFEAIP